MPARSVGRVVAAVLVLMPTIAAAQQPTDPNANPAPKSNLMPGGAVTAPVTTKQVDPNKDAEDLAKQGSERPSTDGSIGAKPNDVFADDWWGRTRPILEVHGYFRTRGELLHNFSLGRHNDPGDPTAPYLWPHPLDDTYNNDTQTTRTVSLCGDLGDGSLKANGQPGYCFDKTQSSANMRFRVSPELHISDNLRILSQIDLLDNLVLGSTPDAYSIKPNVGGSDDNGTGYTSAGFN